MTSPLAALTAKRKFYFDAILRDEIKPFDDVDIYNAEDVELIFTVKDANGEEVDLTGADVSFLAAAYGDSSAIMTKVATVSGSEATVSFNGADLGAVYSQFKGQLIIAKSGNTVVASRGIITLCEVFL